MRFRRFFAIAAIILLLALYASTIIFSIMNSPLAESLLLTSLFCTVVVPAVLYGYSVILKGMKDRK